ncbi:nuclear transport factor 2 family protein [Mesonia maritima]|uniref:SnoaL-like domain-containing protein n=1 Tax=Mesonia maritima TaxID=1793873 RepID=A0ABU1K1L9_9FLAO|nr:nuclear transport factor 2 family protein [Mesonia maritima]MDR6299513.1 hypothetical protein [Mesonia maritima]
MKKVLFFLLFLSSITFQAQEKEIEERLENWHNAAAEANFEEYFSYFTKDAIFIGTDPTEYWSIEAFKNFSKPYFDKGKAWSFTAIDRNIYNSKNAKIVWFDELLQTQMGLCRGSGILKLVNGNWMIAHYVLSISIPNENVEAVTNLKKNFEEKFIQQNSK